MAYEELVRKLTPKLRGIVHRIYTATPSVDGADLMQEALLHLWRQAGCGALEDKTDSYILQGCYFHLKNYVRMIKGRNRLVSIDEEGEEENDCAKTVLFRRCEETAADYRAYLNDRLLADVIINNGLTAKEKALLPWLSLGLTTREIGARVGVSHVAVVKMTKVIRGKCLKYLDKE